MQDVEQVAGEAGKPVEAGYHEHIARLQPPQQLGEFGPVATGTADLLRIDLRATGSMQLCVLRPKCHSGLL